MARVKSATSTSVSQFAPLNNDYATIVTTSRENGDSNKSSLFGSKRAFSSNTTLSSPSHANGKSTSTNSLHWNHKNSCNNFNTASIRKETISVKSQSNKATSNQDLQFAKETDTTTASTVGSAAAKSYLFGRQEKLVLSPLSPSAYNRSTKIRFRCPSVDLIVSPSTASAYSSEDCAEISVDSWEDDSPLDDEYSLLYGDKNEFPLSYSKMEEAVAVYNISHESNAVEDGSLNSIKKPMNGHVPHDDGQRSEAGSRRPSNVEDKSHSEAGSRRPSNVEDKSHSDAGSRRASNAADSHHSADGSRRASHVNEEISESNEEAHREKGDEPVESYEAIGEGDGPEDGRVEPEQIDDSAEHAEDDHGDEEKIEAENNAVEEQPRKSSVVSAHSAGSEKVYEETAETKQIHGEEDERRESVVSNAAGEEEIADTQALDEIQEERHDEGEATTDVVEDASENAEVEAFANDAEEHDERDIVKEEETEIEEERDNDNKEVVEEALIEEVREEQAESENKPESDGAVNEDQSHENGFAENETAQLVESVVIANHVSSELPPATRKIRSDKSQSKANGSPRKLPKASTSPRHVGGPPLRGRLRVQARTGAPTSTAAVVAEPKLSHSWNAGLRRTQSQSPGRTTVDDIAKVARNVDLHSIFGRSDSQTEKKKHRDEEIQKKKAEEEEKLLAEKEQRRKDAEAAFQSWLHRKAQERRRARSTGRASTQSEVVRENNAEEKQRNRVEAEAAFQAWLERKKEEQKERQRHMLTASKSQQRIASKEDADEAFRQWKDQKSQQRREERRLIRAQMLEMNTVVPIGDSIRSIRQISYNNVHLQNGLPKLNHFRTISPANRKRVERSDSLPSINSSPDGVVKVS